MFIDNMNFRRIHTVQFLHMQLNLHCTMFREVEGCGAGSFVLMVDEYTGAMSHVKRDIMPINCGTRFQGEKVSK